jgi:NADPH-dependent glutamate synthase beta subunit-like oxidoreductase
MLDPRELTQITHGVPAVAVTNKSTRVNRTGSWKYIRPIYQDKVAPCNQGCPVGIDIEATMNLMREGQVQEAADLLLRENPFPAVTGRVCYRSCERVCNRASFDQAVSIHGVERVLGDLALERPLPEPAARTRRETIGIVGAGPAGLSAAYHLARLGYGVTVYESEPEPGGMLRFGIPSYRLPKPVLKGEIDRIVALGVEIRCGVKVGRDPGYDELKRKHDVVLVASGAQRGRRLGIEGEGLEGVSAGLAFLAGLNRGIRPRIGERVVVIGGGPTAVDCAMAAVRLGATVRLLHHGGREDLSACLDEVQEAACEGVQFELHAAATALIAAPPGDGPEALDGVEASFGEAGGSAASGRIGSVRCVRLAPGDGTRPPEEVPGSEFYLEADTVLVALGEDAEVRSLPGMAGRADGAAPTDPLGATGDAQVFACGDLIAGPDGAGVPRTVADAIGSGKRAAIGIDHHLRTAAGERTEALDLAALRLGPQGNVSMTRWRGDDPVRRAEPINQVVAYEQMNTAHFAHVPRFRDRYMTSDWTRGTFEEANLGLTRDDGVAEARRCFNCGVCNSCEVCLIFCPDAAITRGSDGGFHLSYKYCKGCGVCAAECPRCAMTMTREGL